MLTHQGMDGSPGDMRLTNTVTGIRKWEVVCRGQSHRVAWFVHCSKVLSIWRKKSYPTLFANRAVYPAAWWVCAHQQAAFSPGLSAQNPFPFYRVIDCYCGWDHHVWPTNLTNSSCFYQPLLAQLSKTAGMLTKCFWRALCPLLAFLLASYWFLCLAWRSLSQEPSRY